jgi:hypothetical protein
MYHDGSEHRYHHYKEGKFKRPLIGLSFAALLCRLEMRRLTNGFDNNGRRHRDTFPAPQISLSPFVTAGGSSGRA